MSSGVIPQDAVPSWDHVPAGAVYSPAITDYIIMVKDSSYMFVTTDR